MTISKSTMKEIIETDKQIIERLTKELADANETIQILTSNIIEPDKEDYEKLIKEKDKFMQFLDLEKNKNIIDKNRNIVDTNKIEGLGIKVEKKVSDENNLNIECIIKKAIEKERESFKLDFEKNIMMILLNIKMRLKN